MDSVEYSGEGLPKAIEEIVLQIISHKRVLAYRVQNIDDGVTIECDWLVMFGSRDVKKRITDKGVRRVEPVCWHVPFTFPSAPILPSLRRDFPRTEFPHINPSDAMDVVWPCITETCPTSFLLAHGLPQLLIQMDTWLDRAAIDRLMVPEQGWEPVIFNQCGGSFIDIDSSLISSAQDIIAKLTLKAEFYVKTGSYQTFANRPLLVSASSEGVESGQSPVEILEVFFPPTSTTKLFQNAPVTNRAELIDFVASLEGEPDLPAGQIVFPVPKFSAGEELRINLDNRDKGVSKLKTKIRDSDALGCIVVLCIPRPEELIGGTTNIEVIPFFVRLSQEQNANPEVIHLSFIQGGSSEILQHVSHKNKREIKRVAFLGAGSVGSKIAVSLARSGSYSMTLIDNGLLRPHNLARHGLSNIGRCAGWPKAILLHYTISNLGVCSDFNMQDLAKGSLAEIEEAELLIESTGNELVSYKLTLADKLPGRLCQVGLYGEASMGYLAFESYTGDREVRIDDLEAVMYCLSLNDSEVATSLFGKAGIDRQIVGYGCSSETTIMPDTAINLTCAAITEKVDRSFHRSTENPVYGELHLCFKSIDSSISWKSYYLPPTKVIHLHYGSRPWEVRLIGSVVDKMFLLRQEKLPCETGGAIIGFISEMTGRIYVADAYSSFERAVELPSEFSFDQRDLSNLDEDLRAKSHGRIYVLGTWHSHTLPSKPSEQDKKTLCDLNNSFKLPVTTMLMCDGDDIVAVEQDHASGGL